MWTRSHLPFMLRELALQGSNYVARSPLREVSLRAVVSFLWHCLCMDYATKLCLAPCALRSYRLVVLTAGLIKAVRAALRIPVHVLLRPRGGDFLYSSQELLV